MKKPTAAEIAQEFARAAAIAKGHPKCGPCNLPAEVREAIPLCLEGDMRAKPPRPPMAAAELARQIRARTGKIIDPQSLTNHYRDHVRRAA